jgi:transposase
MSPNCAPTTIATIGIDLGKNTFHLVGLDTRGAIVLQLKLSRGQIERRLANVPCCLIGMEACSGAHHIGRRLTELGHDVRLIPAQYVKPFLKGHKNDYRDAEAIAEAVQRPTMRFVAIKTPEQMDLLALHRVRSRLERIPNEWNIPGIGEIVDAFLRSEATELIADGVPQRGDGARSDVS